MIAAAPRPTTTGETPPARHKKVDPRIAAMLGPVCPACQETCRRAGRHGWRDAVRAWFGWYPWRCPRCQKRRYYRRRH